MAPPLNPHVAISEATTEAFNELSKVLYKEGLELGGVIIDGQVIKSPEAEVVKTETIDGVLHLYVKGLE